MIPTKHLATLAALSAAALSTALLPAASAQVSRTEWGKTADGKPVELYTLHDEKLTVRITTYGARIVSIEAPDRAGKSADVVLGYNSLAGYLKDTPHFGSIVGRYGNRIAKGTFTLDGQTSHIPINNNGNSLHGGPQGFDTKVWTAAPTLAGVELTLVSPDGDMGFPGELTAHVRYTLHGSSLTIEYSATTTRPTVLNLTNHSYFNLSGESSGSILNEQMMIPANTFTPVDATQIPTGKLQPVAGTPFDFRKPHALGERIHATDEQLKIGGGYDHNFVLGNAPSPTPRLAAEVFDPASGRTLTVRTTEPAVQLYTGNSLDGTIASPSGVKYGQNSAFCLETQHFPDSPNHPKFPSTELKPGQTFHSMTIFTFGVKP